MAGRAWTGRDATALRIALRQTVEGFAGKLGVSARQVSGWAEKPSTKPRSDVQRLLDRAFSEASAEARSRFGELCSPENPVGTQPFRVAMAVVTRGDEVLLVKRREDNSGIRTGFPAGTVKPGADPAATAVRETLSETGVECAVTGHVGGRVHPVTGVRCEYFACTYVAGEAENRDENENAGVMWVPVTELTDHIPRGAVFPPVLEILEGQHV